MPSWSAGEATDRPTLETRHAKPPTRSDVDLALFRKGTRRESACTDGRQQRTDLRRQFPKGHSPEHFSVRWIRLTTKNTA
jgi:hypothetical protein